MQTEPHYIKRHIFLCLALVLLAGHFFSATAQTIYVPSDHWVYNFLDRMETKQLLPIVLNGTKPMTRIELAEHIAELENHAEKLSRTEQRQLELLKLEFLEEIQRLNVEPPAVKTRWKQITEHSWLDRWLPDVIYPTGRHMVEWKSGPLNLYLDPIIRRSRMVAQADTLDAQERVFKDTNGLHLWGTLGAFGFVTDVRDTREWGTRVYPSGNTTMPGFGFAQGNGRQVYHDETVAYLVYHWNYLNLQFGKDSNQWGPAAAGQLFLSDVATSYDQLKVQVVLPRLKFTYVLAWLKQFNPNYYLGNATTKMMSTHRLEVAPFQFLDVGLHSAVIYAGRQFEPAYVNPVMFFRSAEHYLGDLDNALMGLDVEFKAIPKTKLYGELFLDDITTGRLGEGFYGNKYGYTAGLYHVNLFGIANLDARLEYTRIRPYTYTHKHDTTQYQHFSTILGHWIGPNSDYLMGQLDYRLSKRTRFELQVEQWRHGANPPDENLGGDPNVPHENPRDPQSVDFLAGVLERTRAISLAAHYEVLRDLYLSVELKWFDGDSEWPQYGGVSPGARSQITLELRWNY